jgi:hypothetical protein
VRPDRLASVNQTKANALNRTRDYAHYVYGIFLPQISTDCQRLFQPSWVSLKDPEIVEGGGCAAEINGRFLLSQFSVDFQGLFKFF